jgi:hypothetical protein
MSEPEKSSLTPAKAGHWLKPAYRPAKAGPLVCISKVCLDRSACLNIAVSLPPLLFPTSRPPNSLRPQRATCHPCTSTSRHRHPRLPARFCSATLHTPARSRLAHPTPPARLHRAWPPDSPAPKLYPTSAITPACSTPLSAWLRMPSSSALST